MTTYSRRVSDSVSVSEMLHMRNVLGLSNGEIAQRVGCCTATVKRMIGVHPEEKKAKRKSKPMPPVADKPVEEMPAKSFRQRCEEVFGAPEKVEVVETVIKTKADLQKRLDEMVLLFGKAAVKAYLRCAGYMAGTLDGMPVLTSDECFQELKKMEGE